MIDDTFIVDVMAKSRLLGFMAEAEKVGPDHPLHRENMQMKKTCWELHRQYDTNGWSTQAWLVRDGEVMEEIEADNLAPSLLHRFRFEGERCSVSIRKWEFDLMTKYGKPVVEMMHEYYKPHLAAIQEGLDEFEERGG